MGRYVVLGASGALGTEVCGQVLRRGHQVSAIASTEQSLSRLQSKHRDIDCFRADVRSDLAVADIAYSELHADGRVDGVIYLVGRCPEGGFDNVIAHRLEDPQVVANLQTDLDLHVIGALTVFGEFSKDVREGGSFTFISSACNRVLQGGAPDWLHLGHHGTAIAALDGLIGWMRLAAVTKEKGFIINRVAPGAIDTPFHQKCRRQPPAKLSLVDVATALVDAALGNVQVDREMLPVRSSS